MQLRTPTTGYDVEDIVEKLCKIIFLADFVVRSPKYTKQSGNAKEAADFLIPFNHTLLTFQVKSKKEIKPANEKTEIDFQRINAKIEEGVKQLYTIKKALNDNNILELSNVAGIKIPFDKNEYNELIGIVIIDLLGEEKFTQGERTEILNGFLVNFGIPVHIFLREDFQQILTEIDTLPDFLDYIRKRQALYEKHAITPITNELDLLAIYKTQTQLIDDCLNGKCDLLVIAEGIWNSYQKEHRAAIDERNIANNPSYTIDYIISDLRRSIGYEPEFRSPSKRNDVKQGSIEQYWLSINELSKLPRVIRRGIGDVFVKKMHKAMIEGHGHSLIKYNDDSAFIILCTDKDRQQRANGLYNLTAAAYCGLKLRKAIGVATEPINAKERSFDVIFLVDVTFQNDKELQDIFEGVFGKPSHYKITEYNFQS